MLVFPLRRTVTGTPDPYAAWEWLAQAHPAPDHALRLLLRHGRAALETGLRWDAVQVPETTGLLALELVHGPAFRDTARGAVLFLVPPTDGWGARGTAHLTDGTMVCVPAPDTRSPAPADARSPEPVDPPDLYWLTPPDGSDTLTDPLTLFEALTTAAPDEEGPLWCGLCGRPGPTTSGHRPGPDGGGHRVPAHEACAVAGK
ncbi:hypothetical protein RND61_03720 [Streptomyces sp. TRM76323]|uniref:Uncharacterized protein n=1 Tax=Streptomyces tamarix TaxID=3078565 RepID=A0ABU3QEH5_9ACTN|nr:hypothetical protein [Streptomyces tamarix]MDT9681188.1 hypothetical protein [Streptomyces tamarix]